MVNLMDEVVRAEPHRRRQLEGQLQFGELNSMHQRQIFINACQIIFDLGIDNIGKDDYYWSDGKPSVGSFTNWKRSQPMTNRGCGALALTGSWRTKTCRRKAPFVCQISEYRLTIVLLSQRLTESIRLIADKLSVIDYHVGLFETTRQLKHLEIFFVSFQPKKLKVYFRFDSDTTNNNAFRLVLNWIRFRFDSVFSRRK